MTKVTKSKFLIKFLVRAVVELEIYAENFNQAEKLGREKMRKIKTFNDELDYLDGNETFIGIDNLDLWNEVLPMVNKND